MLGLSTGGDEVRFKRDMLKRRLVILVSALVVLSSCGETNATTAPPATTTTQVVMEQDLECESGGVVWGFKQGDPTQVGQPSAVLAAEKELEARRLWRAELRRLADNRFIIVEDSKDIGIVEVSAAATSTWVVLSVGLCSD
jgi:hypothetical protein